MSLADKRYALALGAGDMVEARRLVEERASQKGYRTGPLWHGTTHEFTVFSMDRSNMENDWGNGFYFSSDRFDSTDNYAGIGPDLAGRIERLAEMLANDGMSEDEAMDEARRELVGPTQRVMEVVVRMRKPAVMGWQGSTFIEGSDWKKLKDALEVVEREFYGVDKDAIMEEARVLDHDYLWNVFKRIRDSDVLDNVESTSGQPAQNELQRRILELMGFDGIVDKTVGGRFGHVLSMPSRGVFHVIVWDPRQVKLLDAVTKDDFGNVIPLSKRFDPRSKDIRNPRTRRPPEFPFAWADALRRNHPSIWARGGNIRGNDTFRLWARRRRGERSPAIDHWWDVERPAWIARHFDDHRLPGVVAQIKWGAVGRLGVAGMKRVVEDAIGRGR